MLAARVAIYPRQAITAVGHVAGDEHLIGDFRLTVTGGDPLTTPLQLADADAFFYGAFCGLHPANGVLRASAGLLRDHFGFLLPMNRPAGMGGFQLSHLSLSYID